MITRSVWILLYLISAGADLFFGISGLISLASLDFLSFLLVCVVIVGILQLTILFRGRNVAGNISVALNLSSFVICYFIFVIAVRTEAFAGVGIFLALLILIIPLAVLICTGFAIVGLIASLIKKKIS